MIFPAINLHLLVMFHGYVSHNQMVMDMNTIINGY